LLTAKLASARRGPSAEFELALQRSARTGKAVPAKTATIPKSQHVVLMVDLIKRSR
jgi:hypothetical protein